MERQAHYMYRSSICCRLVFKLLPISIVILASGIRVNADILYVSKAYGNDTNGDNLCRNMTSPCKTLSHVINRSSADDVIMMDSTDTTLQPYTNCPSRPFNGSLSLNSWKGEFAVINCSGGVLVFRGGSKGPGDENVELPHPGDRRELLGSEVDLGEVRFHGLTFYDTPVRLIDVSLRVTMCSFTLSLYNDSFLYTIDISVSERILAADLNVIITDSTFTQNMAGCLRVVNHASTEVFLEIRSSSFANNTLAKLEQLILLRGLVSFNFFNSEISHTVFPIIGLLLIQPSVIRLSNITREKGRENGFLLNNTHLPEETLSVLSIYFWGGNFYQNHGNIFSASFNSSVRVAMVDTNFSRNTYFFGGVVVVNSENAEQSTDVRFTDCWFNSNEGFTRATVVYLKTHGAVLCNVSLENCHFNDNRDGRGYEYERIGATLYIEVERLSLSVISCAFYRNHASMTAGVYVKTSQRSALRFNRTTVRSCNSWAYNREGSGGITVLVQKYSLCRDGNSESGLWIDQCEFSDNSAGEGGSGAVVLGSYSSEFPSGGNIIITRSSFVNNTAQNGAGGVNISSNFNCHISDALFLDNAGYKAGGIYFSGAELTLRHCTLNNNFGGSTASSFASGTLRLSGSGNALIRDSKIVQKDTSRFFRSAQFHGEVAVSSTEFGSLTILNSTLEFLWKPSIEKVMVVEVLHSSLTLDNNTVIRCPVGYDIQNISAGETTLGRFDGGASFQCRLCPFGTYSEDRGYYHLYKKHSVECLGCPYGAKCLMGLHVLPNFWGYKINNRNPPEVAFSICPSGYCCQPEAHHKSCTVYNTCNAQRQGRLCGECKPKFSETLFSPTCRKSEKCNDFWFWPAAVIFVLGFSLYVILQPDFVTIFWNWITWFSRDDAGAQPPADGVTPRFDPGYERIVFFYYQATQVLLVRNSIDVLDKYVGSQFILGLFNFEVRLNNDGFACPFPGLNSVSKIFFQFLGVFSVLFAIPAIFLLHYSVCSCLRRARPTKGPYLSAFVKAILLGYAVLMEKSLSLLNCVEVNGVNCLFVNCNIQCYTWWQILIGTSVLVILLPFALVLFFGAYKLFDKQISASHFLLACLLPLPYLSHWFLTRRHFRARHVPDSDDRDIVTSVVIGSYRAPDHVSRGAIYWESVLIARILVLILADVLIRVPLMRSLTLVLICVLNLSVHIYVFPFEHQAANRVETMSLFCLVLVAIFGVPYSGYLSEGVMVSGPIPHIMKIFSWCQVVLVIFLPAVFVFLVFAAALSQAVRLFWFLGNCFRRGCCRCFCCKRCVNDRNVELFDALVQ